MYRNKGCFLKKLFRVLCHYELNGVCNDETCQFQHEKDYLLSDKDAYLSLRKYMPSRDESVEHKQEHENYELIAKSYIEDIASQLQKQTDILFLSNNSNNNDEQQGFQFRSIESYLLKKEKQLCAFLQPFCKLQSDSYPIISLPLKVNTMHRSSDIDIALTAL